MRLKKTLSLPRFLIKIHTVLLKKIEYHYDLYFIYFVYFVYI